ncbi:MAG: BTAD domain-containing putative transcriptional regulator, partial [Actinomycetota bacterium]|nr:BTAD domain-containing putative transcriptional regulator [Actinomycetota bacterium]
MTSPTRSGRAAALRLDDLHLQGSERHAELRIESGESASVVAELRALTAGNPLREKPHRLLALALHLGGSQPEAVRVYQSFRDRVVDETGLDPSPEFQALEQQILTGDPGLQPAGRVRLGSYEIGAALAVAHDAGVLHRDVKPANILFDEVGNSYLADFGIATAVGSREVTDLRSAGSPLYVSPEQVRDGEATPASDVYGFGVVLYELLTGRPPFADSDSVGALLDRKVRERVPSIAAERPEVPAAVDLVIQTATAVDPTRRFPSIGELVLAFRAATAGLPDAAGSTAGDGTAERPRGLAAQTLVGLELEGVNPYKGLAAFSEADRADFHGRSQLADELVERLDGSRFVVVTGPSGSGKSSVV